MKNYYYCLDCKRIFSDEDKCSYCNGEKVKSLVPKAPVNVLGSKLKGKVLSTKDDKINVLFYGEGKGNKYIKEYSPEQLKKVL